VCRRTFGHRDPNPMEESVVTLVIAGDSTGVLGTDLTVPPPSKERAMSYPCLDPLLSCCEKPCSYHILECIQSCIVVDNARKESIVGFSLPNPEPAWVATGLPLIIMPCQVGVPVIPHPTSVTSARGNGKSVGYSDSAATNPGSS